MPIFQETRNSVRQAIGRTTGKMLGTYTVTIGSPSSVRAANLFLREASLGKGMELYVYTGGGSGQSRTVISATAGVQGTGSILYPHLNFSPAPSTNASIELWRAASAPDVTASTHAAIRNAARRILDHKEDYSFTLGDPLGHWGAFQ